MGVLTDTLRGFLDANRVGVLATVAANGTRASAPQRPEPPSDEALAAAERVILAITIERVSAINHLDG
jgi:hypothetical protein